MNFNQLQYYVTAIKQGNYSLAAKTFCVTPQAISKSIKELEKEIDTKLLVKVGKNIQPTQNGKLFYCGAQEVLKAYSDLELLTEKFRGLSLHKESLTKEVLKLGVAIAPLEGLIFRKSGFDLFNKLFPSVDLSVTYGSNGACLSALEDGSVDAAIIFGRIEKKDISCIKVAAYQLGIIMSLRHPLATGSTIKIHDLEKYKIAFSGGLGFGNSHLKHVLENYDITPKFVDLMPLANIYQKFIKDEQGIVFSAYAEELHQLYPGAVLKKVEDESLFSMPACFVYKTERINTAIPALEKCLLYYKDQMQNKSDL